MTTDERGASRNDGEEGEDAMRRLVPLAGIEPALLAELDFESSASTNSATGAFAGRPEAAVTKPAKYNGRPLGVNPRSAGAGGAKQDTPV